MLNEESPKVSLPGNKPRKKQNLCRAIQPKISCPSLRRPRKIKDFQFERLCTAETSMVTGNPLEYEQNHTSKPCQRSAAPQPLDRRYLIPQPYDPASQRHNCTGEVSLVLEDTTEYEHNPLQQFVTTANIFNPIQPELFYNTFNPRGASEAPHEFFLENTIVDRKNRKK